MALDQQQIQQLHAAKLCALARNNLGFELVDVAAMKDGAVGSTPRDFSPRAVVYLAEKTPKTALGKALVSCLDRAGESLHIMCAAEPGAVARTAEEFELDICVWEIVDAELMRTGPWEHHEGPQPDDAIMGLVADIIATGADPVVEHGVLTGEVRGLEIMRAHNDSDALELRVGVGDFDRELFAMMNGPSPSRDVVSEVVATVAEHRRPGAVGHPLNRIATERWLRAALIDEPSRIGFETLVASEPPVPRGSVKEVVPAVALGSRAGADVVVVISCGIDLELIPFAADARRRLAPESDLVVVVPERDAHRVTTELAARLRRPAEVVTVADDWRTRPPDSVARRA